MLLSYPDFNQPFEIHTDWRDQIISGAGALPIEFTSAVTNHEASDAAGDVLDKADVALYWSKQSGRDRVTVYRGDFGTVKQPPDAAADVISSPHRPSPVIS